MIVSIQDLQAEIRAQTQLENVVNVRVGVGGWVLAFIELTTVGVAHLLVKVVADDCQRATDDIQLQLQERTLMKR